MTDTIMISSDTDNIVIKGLTSIIFFDEGSNQETTLNIDIDLDGKTVIIDLKVGDRQHVNFIA